MTINHITLVKTEYDAFFNVALMNAFSANMP